jgi:phosphatidylcholine synthase
MTAQHQKKQCFNAVENAKSVANRANSPHICRTRAMRDLRVIRRIFNYRKVPYAEIRAFSVHLLTASGSFLAFLGVVAAAEHRFVDMFWWLGLALLVDGIDGPIARKVKVKEVLPNWSGDTLDNIIDYVTYVLLPAFALYQSGMIGEPWSFFAAGAIVVSSAVYYADMGMKTDEYFFSGFPVVWNMVIFTLFVIDASAMTALIVVSVSVVLTFFPINFLHPVRVKRLRAINLAVCLLWCALGGYSLLLHFNSPDWVVWGVVLSGIYLYCIGGVLQLFPNLGK